MYFLGAYHCCTVGDLTIVRRAIQWPELGGKWMVKNTRHLTYFVNFNLVFGKVCDGLFIFRYECLETNGTID